MRRTVEITTAAIGLGLSALLLGGFTLVVNAVDEAGFDLRVRPAMRSAGIPVPADQAYDVARTLAAWFGLTLVVVAVLAVAGIAAARRRPERRTAGWWFLAAGLACLVGSQLLLYPVAFLFLAAAATFAARPVVPAPPDPRAAPSIPGARR